MCSALLAPEIITEKNRFGIQKVPEKPEVIILNESHHENNEKKNEIASDIDIKSKNEKLSVGLAEEIITIEENVSVGVEKGEKKYEIILKMSENSKLKPSHRKTTVCQFVEPEIPVNNSRSYRRKYF